MKLTSGQVAVVPGGAGFATVGALAPDAAILLATTAAVAWIGIEAT